MGCFLKALAALIVGLLLLTSGGSTLRVSPVELAAAPYRHDLVAWELSNIPDKWVNKLKGLLTWGSRSRDERLEDLRESFALGEEIRGLEGELAAALATRSSSQTPGSQTPGSQTPGSQTPGAGFAQQDPSVDRAGALELRLERLRDERASLRGRVEETLETELDALLGREGLASLLGRVFPPVDVALTRPPRVLVVSPRDRILRQETILLEANMSLEDMEALERRLLEDEGLSALVAGIGGVATYPAIVTEDQPLRHAANTAAHEWLHQYWFFRPLGWSFWGWSADMNTLNETAANVAGRELGRLLYEAIAGTEPPVDAPPSRANVVPPPEDAFDFAREMRATRLRVDELLSEGTVEEAEAYMEKRRQVFGANGYHIRKLNQAYFAFYGTYADSPASSSPIAAQVEQLRDMSESIGDFVRTMAGFGSYQEFQDYLSTLVETGDTGPRAG